MLEILVKRGMKNMLNVDQRLVKSYSILTEDKTNSIGNREEREIFQRTIEYLKSFSMLQEKAEIVKKRESIRLGIDSKIPELEAQIEAKKLELQSVPKLPRRKIKGKSTTNGGFIGKFQELAEKSKAQEIEKRILEIKERKSSIKAEILSMNKEIKKLEKWKVYSTQNKAVISQFFSKENEELSRKRQGLLNLCQNVMFSGEENNIFSKTDNGEIKVNLLSAKRFLKKIKDRDTIIEVANHYEVVHEAALLEKEIGKLNEEKKTFELAKQLTDSDDMKMIINKMNEIATEYNQLIENEHKTMKRSFINRFQNRIRFFLRKEMVIPKKLIRKREMFAEKITDFSLYLNENPERLKTFDIYQKVKGEQSISEDGSYIETLRDFATKVRMNPHKIRNPITPFSDEEYKKCTELMNEGVASRLQNKNTKLEEMRKKADELQANFSEKATKLIATDGEEKIASYATKYYDFGTSNRYDSQLRVSPSVMAMVLESIIGRSGKNLSWDKFVRIYGDVVGKEKLAEDTINMYGSIMSKINTITEKIKGNNKENDSYDTI